MLGLIRQAVLQRIARGSLPAERVGEKYVIQRGAVEALEPRLGAGDPQSP